MAETGKKRKKVKKFEYLEKKLSRLNAYLLRAVSSFSFSDCFCNKFSTVAVRKFSSDSNNNGSFRERAISYKSSRYSCL